MLKAFLNNVIKPSPFSFPESDSFSALFICLLWLTHVSARLPKRTTAHWTLEAKVVIYTFTDPQMPKKQKWNFPFWAATWSLQTPDWSQRAFSKSISVADRSLWVRVVAPAHTTTSVGAFDDQPPPFFSKSSSITFTVTTSFKRKRFAIILNLAGL